MKITVMGAGALGCYYGGRLAAAGEDVTFIGRGPHLQALQSDGLRIESPLGDVHLPKVRAFTDPADAGPADMVLFLVKLYDTEEAARQMAPLLGPETAVLSLQNGVNSRPRISAIVGVERVIGGTAAIPAVIREPGVVLHGGSFSRITFGEFDGNTSHRCTDLLARLTNAGVEARNVPNIDAMIWEKFVMLSAFSAVTALTRLPIGPIRKTPETAQMLRDALAETAAVGFRSCPGLAADIADRQWAAVSSLPETMKASMLHDLERSKRLELNDLSGEVVRLGQKFGIPTPVHGAAHAALQPFVSGPVDLPR